MRYYVKKSQFLLYQQQQYFEITGDPYHLIGSHGHDKRHKMELL